MDTAPNRENWLTAAARIMWPWVLRADKTLRNENDAARGFTKPSARINQIKFSTSLMSGGLTRTGEIGHVQYKHSTKNGKHEIRISPALGGKDRPTVTDTVQVSYVLLHELVHVATPGQGHRGNFPRICKVLGFKGKPTANFAPKNERLWYDIRQKVIDEIGLYPHRQVELPPKRGQRGIGSRLIKCECMSCGCIIRLSRKWIAICHDRSSTPDFTEVTCPVCTSFMEVC